MSSSTHIVGVRDLDAEFAKMLEIKHLCEKNGVSYPKEVEEYFDTDDTTVEDDEDDLRSAMEEIDIDRAYAKMDYNEMQDCWEVDLSLLPPDVKSIRFINSY